jgi:hypothetical protein
MSSFFRSRVLTGILWIEPYFLAKTKGKYRLGCASGILNVAYGANELNLVEADFPELDNILPQKLSLREAAKTQNVVECSLR